MRSSFQSDPEPHSSAGPLDRTPILIVPYMWIGDFVRCHTVIKLLKRRFPARPVDVLSSTLCAPLADYMPELRQAIIVDLPRKRLSWAEHKALAERLKLEAYGTALIMPRTWKAALAAFLAGIPERIGWVGEWRFGLLNDLRFGERKLPRMVDQCAALALPANTTLLENWPLPELRVPPAEVTGWRERIGLADTGKPVVALAPGAVGSSKRWPGAAYAELARRLIDHGTDVWIVGGPGEAPLVRIIQSTVPAVRDLTGTDLRNAILALAAADVAVSNDSGLLHVAAAIGTPAIGIFGPTSPWHWAPLNPIAAAVQTASKLDCQPCHKPTCRMRHHRCMRDISAEQVLKVTQQALAEAQLA